jgi:hypothetical protein
LSGSGISYAERPPVIKIWDEGAIRILNHNIAPIAHGLAYSDRKTAHGYLHGRPSVHTCRLEKRLGDLDIRIRLGPAPRASPLNLPLDIDQVRRAHGS